MRRHALDEGAVRVIGRGDVDGVDGVAGAQLVELVVRDAVLDVVVLGELLQLLRIARHERHQLRRLLGVLERGQDRLLREMPEPDDGVTNSALGHGRNVGPA